MAVKVVNNTARVINNVENYCGLAIRWTLEDIYANATPVTPMNKGDLRARVLRTMEGNLKGAITWQSSYAGVQELGHRRGKNGTIYFRNYTTPGTGPHYAENAVKNSVDNFPQYLEKASI